MEDQYLLVHFLSDKSDFFFHIGVTGEQRMFLNKAILLKVLEKL